MAEFPALPLFTDAYMADTDHLTDVEHGRYLRLLILTWRSPKCRIPNDDEWLARRFRRNVDEVQRDLRPLLSEFFQTDGNWLFQKRLRTEWEWNELKRRDQSVRAKSRWQKEKAVSRSSTHKSEPALPPTQPNPTQPSKKEDSAKAESVASDPTIFGRTVLATAPVASLIEPAHRATDDWPSNYFDLFWYAYPSQRRTDKAKVAKKLDVMRRAGTVTWRDLMGGLERYKQSRDVKRGFAKGTLAWLNGGCWDDEIGGGPEAVQTPKRKPSLLTRIALGIDGEDHDARRADHDGPTLDLRPVPHR